MGIAALNPSYLFVMNYGNNNNSGQDLSNHERMNKLIQEVNSNTLRHNQRLARLRA
jgi:hypothetical protein